MDMQNAKDRILSVLWSQVIKNYIDLLTDWCVYIQPIHFILWDVCAVVFSQLHKLSSTTLSNCRLLSNFVNGHTSNMWFIICCLPLHRQLIWQGPIGPLCSFAGHGWKWFNRRHSGTNVQNEIWDVCKVVFFTQVSHAWHIVCSSARTCSLECRDIFWTTVVILASWLLYCSKSVESVAFATKPTAECNQPYCLAARF